MFCTSLDSRSNLFKKCSEHCYLYWVKTEDFWTWKLQLFYLQNALLYFKISQKKSCRFDISLQLSFQAHFSEQADLNWNTRCSVNLPKSVNFEFNYLQNLILYFKIFQTQICRGAVALHLSFHALSLIWPISCSKTALNTGALTEFQSFNHLLNLAVFEFKCWRSFQLFSEQQMTEI